MHVAVRIAGYSMSEADNLRKVMGKKIRSKVEAERKIFDLIAPFADYGFNVAHACAYAYVSYQTAYLKAHHPVEYMAAVLTSVKDDKDRKPFYLNACRLMDLQVLPPDVNGSELDFAPPPPGGAGGSGPPQGPGGAGGSGSPQEPDGERRQIRYGLSAVRNV